MNLSIAEIRQAIREEEFSSENLNRALSRYSFPRQKAAMLEKKGVIVRIKRGWYVWRKELRNRPVCLPYLANKIYRPSYVSMHYALHHHGLITKPPQNIVSMTTAKKISINSSLHPFTYSHIPLRAFNIGIDVEKITSGNQTIPVLMAGSEKALADTLIKNRQAPITKLQELENILFKELKISELAINSLSLKLTFQIACAYRSRIVTSLYEFLAQRI